MGGDVPGERGLAGGRGQPIGAGSEPGEGWEARVGFEFGPGGVVEAGSAPRRRGQRGNASEGRGPLQKGQDRSQPPGLPGPWVQSNPAARRAAPASGKVLSAPSVPPRPASALPPSPLGQHLLEPLALGWAGDVRTLATEQFLVAGAVGADEGTWGHLRVWVEAGSHWGWFRSRTG